MKPTISIVTIAKNEEHTIADILEEAIPVLKTVASKYEIVVNDDASMDRTPQILDKLRRKYPCIRVFHQSRSLGIAQGVEFLYQKARYTYVYILPGDGQYTAHDLQRMLTKALAGCDIVVGKRVQKRYTLWRAIVSYLFNMSARIFFHVETFDAGSIKLYHRKILRDFQPISRGVFNEAERIIRAKRAGYRICESPAHHFVRVGGKATGAKPSLILEACIDMIRLWYLLNIRHVIVL